MMCLARGRCVRTRSSGSTCSSECLTIVSRHGSRLWLCWLRVPRDHRTHTLPERHCKQAMLARGRWQATFTRDTIVLLPRSCTGFFLHASMPSKAKSNSAGKKPMGSGMQQTTLVARRSVVSPSNGSPKSDQLGLGGKKNRKKKKAPTHKKMCVTPRLAGRLRAGGPDAELQPAQRGVRLGA